MRSLTRKIVEKTNVNGTIKDEMVLACNALRKDLLSPNEYVRGRTLRLVSKIPVRQVLETLLPSVTENLQHRHFYVRRNAIMCLYAIYKSQGLDFVEDCAP